MPPKPLYISCDNLIEYDGMIDEADGSYVNNATVTFALKDSDGNTVSSATGSLSYVSASNGIYQGVIVSSVSLTAGTTYYLEITASSSSRDDFRRIECKAQYHGTMP